MNVNLSKVSNLEIVELNDLQIDQVSGGCPLVLLGAAFVGGAIGSAIGIAVAG